MATESPHPAAPYQRRRPRTARVGDCVGAVVDMLPNLLAGGSVEANDPLVAGMAGPRRTSGLPSGPIFRRRSIT